jgi:two-component system sensor kinase FixL
VNKRRGGFHLPDAPLTWRRNLLALFERLSGAPLSLRMAACVLAVGASLLLREALSGVLDEFSGHYLFYPAIVISAFFCGVGGGVAAVAAFVLLAPGFLSAPPLPDQSGPVNFRVFVDFLVDSTVYIALGRLPAAFAYMGRESDDLLRINAEQLEQFVEQAPPAMAMFDRDMRYLALSARWREDYGLGPEAIGRSAYEALLDGKETWRDAHRRAMAGEIVREERDVFIRGDGSAMLLRWETRPWFERSGKIGGIIIFAENISERGRVQQALEESERRLAAIFNSAMDAIVTIDRRGVIQSANPAACDMFGYSVEELTGCNVGVLMPEHYARQHDRFIDHYAATGEKKIIGKRRTVEGLRRNGAVFTLELTVSEAADAGGPHFVGIMRDLSPIESERKRVSALRDELARVSRVNDMGEMAGGLAHEVGQPVAAILNFAAAYRRALATTGRAPQGDVVGKIEAQARRAAAIIKRLRGFIENRPPDRERVEIERLIDDALQLVPFRSRPKILRPPPPPELAGGTIFVDPIQIEQVLVSLLRNADDALIESEPAEIVIETALAGKDRIRVSVADTGAGVAPEAVEELFAPFFTTKLLGMGVGLSISKTIVESHGGSIHYHPNAPRGSIFTFELPVCAPDGRNGAELTRSQDLSVNSAISATTSSSSS